MVVALSFSGILCTCAPAQDPPLEEHHHEEEHHDDDHHDAGNVHLTPAQVDAMEIGYGLPHLRKVNDYLRVTGTLGLPPNAYASVSARASGYLRNARNYVEGDYVRPGATIAYLENPDFIEHQREYLEATAELSYLKQELDRQEALLTAEAGVIKDVQRLRSEVAAKRARVAGLAKRLSYLGLPTDALTPETITDRVALSTSRGGYVTSIILHEGMYVEPTTEIMELIDEDHLHLELDVFERNVGQVKKGQRVSYTIPALDGKTYEAEVHVIGKEFDTENKTVRVHAHPVGEQPPFIRDLFAEARIWLDSTSVPALPEGAIFREGEVAYVFAGPERDGDELAFRRLRVATGATEGGYTAVRMIDSLPAGMQIVTEGAYYIYAQGLAGELQHEH
jgi:cobalt-zinc-cadmium efflux system membrane fusion protein